VIFSMVRVVALSSRSVLGWMRKRAIGLRNSYIYTLPRPTASFCTRFFVQLRSVVDKLCDARTLAAAARLVNIIVSCIHNAKFFSTNADNDREWILHFVSGVQISLCRKRTTASYSGEGYNGTSQIQAIFFVNSKSHVKDGFSATNIDNLTDIKLAN